MLFCDNNLLLPGTHTHTHVRKERTQYCLLKNLMRSCAQMPPRFYTFGELDYMRESALGPETIARVSATKAQNFESLTNANCITQK